MFLDSVFRGEKDCLELVSQHVNLYQGQSTCFDHFLAPIKSRILPRKAGLSAHLVSTKSLRHAVLEQKLLDLIGISKVITPCTLFLFHIFIFRARFAPFYVALSGSSMCSP